jgi:hypothetical protein
MRRERPGELAGHCVARPCAQHCGHDRRGSNEATVRADLQQILSGEGVRSQVQGRHYFVDRGARLVPDDA